MNKLEKSIKILEKRLPKTHFIPVKRYSSVYRLMKSASIKWHKGSYKKCIAWYSEYLENPKKATYMKTKYYNPKADNKTHNEEAFRITALSDNPIMIAIDNLRGHSLRNTVFLLLHEMGHHYYGRRYNEWHQEHWCDEFAIMWTRRLIKEGLI